MTVATWQQTDFNTQTATAYRSNIDADMAVAAAIVDNFAPHAVATPNMTVQLDPGAIPGVGVIPTTVGLQTSATLTAPATNPRKDIVYIDAVTGVIGVATGTEAVSPVDPAVPAGKIPVARLAMTVGMATITNSIITDLRAPAMAFTGGGFTGINANTTLTIGQSGGRFKLTGATTAVGLPTPVGNANVGYLLWGGDSNTQTISPAAASFKMPDGSSPTSLSVTANQGYEVVSDGSVYQVVRVFDAYFAKTNVKQTWTAQQTPKNGALTDGASIAWNGDTNGQVVGVTLGGNRAMAAPTNIVQYAMYLLRVAQDATGARTLTWDAAFKFGSAGAPTLSTGANKVDFISFVGGAGNTLECLGVRLNAV